MKNTLFNFAIPQYFELIKDKKTSIRLENTKEKYEYQSAYIDISMFHIESIGQQKGDTFLDKYIAWSEGFQTQVISSEKTSFKNYTAYRVDTKTDTVFQEEHFKINYVNLCILLDDTWCVEYQFVYETKEEAVYKSIVESTLQSLDISGTPDSWMQAHMADVRQATLEYKANLQGQDIEEKPTIKVTPFQIPKNNKEYITIGSFNFDFIEEDCQWHTVEYSQKFYVQIKAKTSQIEKATEKGLVDEFGGSELEEGEIQLSFDCKDIYQKGGIPTGELIFEESKTNAPQYIHFRASGIALDFYGKATLKDGWLGINGVLKKSYQDKPCFPITVYKKLPTENIDWSLYQFTLEEVLQIAPETVQYLWIKEYYKSHFPKEIVAFKNLKHLTIHSNINTSSGDVTALKEVVEGISDLAHLTELSICNTSVEELPESIGQLKNLEKLFLSNNQLKSLPASIFKLPTLKYLWLQSNQLMQLPEAINLPALQSADFSKNKLKTLPESLALQPELTTLNLDENPLESLPEVFNATDTITLSIDDKRRLLNYEYQGANGKGTIEWNNEAYFVKNDPEILKVLNEAVKNTVLEKYQKPLKKLALKAVCIKTTQSDTYKNIGNTRFGGLPDLPQGENYPQWEYNYEGEQKMYHYIFIAQLNCEELAPYQDYLPRTGILYFYLEDEESFGCKVVYQPDANNLQSAKK